MKTEEALMVVPKDDGGELIYYGEWRPYSSWLDKEASLGLSLRVATLTQGGPKDRYCKFRWLHYDRVPEDHGFGSSLYHRQLAQDLLQRSLPDSRVVHHERDLFHNLVS